MNFLVLISTGNNRKSKINQIVFIHLSKKKKKVDTGWSKTDMASNRARDPGSFSFAAPQPMVPLPRSPSKMVALAPAIIPTFQLAEWRK